jgi:hypothetical protein
MAQELRSIRDRRAFAETVPAPGGVAPTPAAEKMKRASRDTDKDYVAKLVSAYF